jgi:hypothetical protein
MGVLYGRKGRINTNLETRIHTYFFEFHE